MSNNFIYVLEVYAVFMTIAAASMYVRLRAEERAGFVLVKYLMAHNISPEKIAAWWEAYCETDE